MSKPWSSKRSLRLAAPTLFAALLAACTSTTQAPHAPGDRSASVQRTNHGVAPISAPDFETPAYADAQDNVRQLPNELVSARGERARVGSMLSLTRP